VASSGETASFLASGPGKSAALSVRTERGRL
jgi:hypothetical protein